MPKYSVRLHGRGGLDKTFETPNPDNIKRETERLRRLGLKEGVHFTVKMPENKDGYVRIRHEGIMELTRLSVQAEDPKIRGEAGRFLEHLMARAIGKAKERIEKLIEEGRRFKR